MKNIFLIVLMLIISILTTAQITILTSDMPSPNDSIRMSNALNGTLYNYTLTDTNYVWNFDQLIANSQRSERFMSVSSTPIIYNIVFFSKSNLASRRDDMSILNINITDGYNFFKNSNADFRQVGYGASVNGSPVPVSFKSDDVIYRFPIAYGNTDSSDSEWEVNIPGLAYINETLHRVNTVDGWGSITTPLGTFQCIRIKSEVQQNDTVYYSSTGMGLRIPQNYTEYIWLSKTLPFPILKASVPQFGGAATVEYADSNRQFVAINSSIDFDYDFDIFPNPSFNGFNIKAATTSHNPMAIIISDIQGRELYHKNFHNTYSKYFQKGRFAAGVYLVHLKTENHIQTKKIIIQ